MMLRWPWQKLPQKTERQAEAERAVDKLRRELAERREQMLEAVIKMNKDNVHDR